MKKLFIVLTVFVVVFSSCSFIKEISQTSFIEPKLEVITTSAVLYDFAKEIGGDNVDVTSIEFVVPAGVDPEDFVPSDKYLDRITSGDVLIYAGDVADPWVKNVIKSANETGLTVIDSSVDVEADDPQGKQIIVENIASGLIVADPENKDYYQKMADELETKLGVAEGT